MASPGGSQKRLAMLEVDAVTKWFDTPAGRLTVLQDVSFKLPAGRRLVVMGPSGCGKSTLLAVVGAIDAPSSGTVRLDGEPVLAGSAADQAIFRNRNVGFVFQEHRLLDACTAVDNVLLPVLATRSATRDDVARATELLARVGLASRLGHLPSELSGGERQRVAVARAIMLRPRLVVADEPTGQLDAESAHDLAGLLAELSSEVGCRLVAVTHSDAVAAALVADGRGDVARLVDGRLMIG